MPDSTADTSSSSVPVLPDWYYQTLQNINQRAVRASGAQYTPYTEDRLAGLTPDQLNGQDLARGAAAGTVVSPELVQSNLAYGLSAFDPNEVNRYMSPYTEGVVNEIGRLGNKNLFENVIPGVNTTFSGAGQFGSTRNGSFLNTAIQNNNYNILGKQSEALNSAYNSALKTYTDWHQNSMKNAGDMTNLQLVGANALNTIGEQNRQQDQASMDLAYQDFSDQRDWEKNQINWLSDLSTGQKMQSGTASSTSDGSTPASPLMQGLATMGQIYGLFKS